MRDYGKISTTIWNSQKFRSLESDDAKMLYFYLHTCPHVNSVGCFVLRDGYAAEDLGWEVERYRKGLETLSKASLIQFDEGEKLVRILNFLRFDPFSNVNHAKGAIKIALSLPDCQVKLMLLKEISAMRHADKAPELREGIERVSKGYRTPEPEPEPEPKEEEPNGSLSSGDDETEKSRDEISEAVAAYNRVAQEAGWPEIQVLSKARKSALAARLRESGGLGGWDAALAKARASPWCCGENDRGWTANFDFLTRQSSFAKLMEGNYDQRNPSQIGLSEGRQNRPDPALEQIARLAGLGKASGGRGG